MADIVCISPIDGHEVARRPVASDAQIAATVNASRNAQRVWAEVALKDRCAAVLRFLDAMLAMNDEIVPELAQQMGRSTIPGSAAAGSSASMLMLRCMTALSTGLRA